MDIQISNVNFACRTNAMQLKPKGWIFNWLHNECLYRDTFTRTTFDINKDLKKVRVREKINEGRSAEVFSTNYDGYVLRILRGIKFNPKELYAVDDPNDLVVAADEHNFVQLMKFVKGKPLYSQGWIISHGISKGEYMRQFEQIRSLPDETFAQYMHDVIKIRKNGYDIDKITPNNFLLDEKRIRIVDLEKKFRIPVIHLEDFDFLVNKYQLLTVLKNMHKKELNSFSDMIKNFYDRLIRIARSEGLDLDVPKTDDQGYARKGHLVNYLYYKNSCMIRKLIKKELG